MKEYQTHEAIKMLMENPKFKFKDEDGSVLSLDHNGYLKRNHPIKKNYGCSNGIDENVKPETKWTLIQQQVPFLEAVQAYEKGEKVTCKFPSFINKDTIITETFWFDGKCHMSEPYDRHLGFHSILNGKWYINYED